MTDAEATFVTALTDAAWPLPRQVLFAVLFLIGYWMWSRHGYPGADRAVRRSLGRRLGVRVIWVPRSRAEYPTPFQYIGRYRRWSWGIADERDRTFLADGVVGTASVLVVNVLAGCLPVAVFLYIAIWLRALSYLVFMPACLGAIAIYSIYWSGRYEVAWMDAR